MYWKVKFYIANPFYSENGNIVQINLTLFIKIVYLMLTIIDKLNMSIYAEVF